MIEFGRRETNNRRGWSGRRLKNPKFNMIEFGGRKRYQVPFFEKAPEFSSPRDGLNPYILLKPWEASRIQLPPALRESRFYKLNGS